jgi:hypothetical protein
MYPITNVIPSTFKDVIRKKIQVDSIVALLQKRIKCMQKYETDISMRIDERAAKIAQVMQSQDKARQVSSNIGEKIMRPSHAAKTNRQLPSK